LKTEKRPGIEIHGKKKLILEVRVEFSVRLKIEYFAVRDMKTDAHQFACSISQVAVLAGELNAVYISAPRIAFSRKQSDGN